MEQGLTITNKPSPTEPNNNSVCLSQKNIRITIFTIYCCNLIVSVFLSSAANCFHYYHLKNNHVWIFSKSLFTVHVQKVLQYGEGFFFLILFSSGSVRALQAHIYAFRNLSCFFSSYPQSLFPFRYFLLFILWTLQFLCLFYSGCL